MLAERETNQPRAGSHARLVKIILAWVQPNRLTGISVRYERFVRGFRALGLEPVTVCLPAAVGDYREPVMVAPSPDDLSDERFWRSTGGDVVVLVTWLVLPEVVGAAKRAGLGVVSIADSDGQIGVRAHPRATLFRMWWQHRGLVLRLRATAYWLRLYFRASNRQDTPVLLSASQADRIVVGDPEAMRHLSRFFLSQGRPELAAKVIVVPYPVDECFLDRPVARDREPQIVSIGRWDDPQKDAALLARTIGAYLRRGGRARFLLFGSGGGRWFGALARSWPDQVCDFGPQPPARVAACLSESRSLLMTSRWEGFPVVVSEAMASGCSMVSTDDLPAAVSACLEPGSGTISRGRSARNLAQALQVEMEAWEGGGRRPELMSARWRPRVTPTEVCRRLIEPFGSIPHAA